jgi:hypothetical protein
MLTRMRVCDMCLGFGEPMLIALCAEERQRLADAVKHHQRDRNREPSEPAG